MLNMIIAIMNDTYQSLMSVQKEQRLRMKCFLIYWHEFIFRRETRFKNTKYIVIAQVDNLKNSGEDDWEGQVQNIKGFID